MIISIDPKVDFAFKYLFGKERNIPLLISLLNAVLQPAPGAEIIELKLLNPTNDKESADDKLSIVDVKARDSVGRFFDVEMQIVGGQSFKKRLLHYWAALHHRQLGAGDNYTDARPTISVCFTDFEMFPQVAQYRLLFEFCNLEHRLVFGSDMQLYLLELPKFKLETDELANRLDMWLYFLCNAQELELKGELPVSMDTPEIRRAMEELKVLSQDDLERERYEARLRVLRDEKSHLHDAREEGRQEGRQEGQQEELVQTVRFCQRILGIAQSPINELMKLSVDELKKQAEVLKASVEGSSS